MKKMYFASLLAVSTLVVSCGETETAAENQDVNYSIDTEATTLTWTGAYLADGHTHSGTVKVVTGDVAYQGEEFKSGEFSIDLNSIEDTDLESPKKDTLESHLKGMYFFNITESAEVKVVINSITDKEISATINLLGKKVEAKMPLKIKKDDKSFTAKGKFTIDFASAEIMGFSPMPGDPENMHVDSKINFELNLKMKK